MVVVVEEEEEEEKTMCGKRRRLADLDVGGRRASRGAKDVPAGVMGGAEGLMWVGRAGSEPIQGWMGHFQAGQHTLGKTSSSRARRMSSGGSGYIRRDSDRHSRT